MHPPCHDFHHDGPAPTSLGCKKARWLQMIREGTFESNAHAFLLVEIRYSLITDSWKSEPSCIYSSACQHQKNWFVQKRARAQTCARARVGRRHPGCRARGLQAFRESIHQGATTSAQSILRDSSYNVTTDIRTASRPSRGPCISMRESSSFSGPSGAGKTTFIKLMMLLEHVSEGRRRRTQPRSTQTQLISFAALYWGRLAGL